MFRSVGILGAMAVLGLAPGAPARAGSYVFTTLDPPGSSLTEPTSINDNGRVAGFFCCTPGNQGFVWDAGALQIVTGPDPSIDLYLYGINQAGLAVGRYGISQVQGNAVVFDSATGSLSFPFGPVTDPSNAFLVAVNEQGVAAGSATVPGAQGPSRQAVTFAQGLATQVPLPADTIQSELYGINDAGTAWGYAVSPTTAGYFTFAGGQVSPVVFPPNFSLSRVVSISEQGALIGSARVFLPGQPNVVSGFIYNGQMFNSFHAPGAGSTLAVATNAIGLFGEYSTGPVFRHGNAFVRIHGQYYDIDPPGSTDTIVAAVNAAGSVVGSYRNGNGVLHGFVAICTPDQQPCTQ